MKGNSRGWKVNDAYLDVEFGGNRVYRVLRFSEDGCPLINQGGSLNYKQPSINYRVGVFVRVKHWWFWKKWKLILFSKEEGEL